MGNANFNQLAIACYSKRRAVSFAPCMVRKSELDKLRMRKINISKAVPLDVVPEHRDFGPVIAFLSFRYQSSPTGREGERCRPLNHM